jgi:IclR family transcriptional regulator, KDG regulon repressor
MSRIGSHAPVYCTAVGKALLSGLPTDQVVSILKGMDLEKRTPNTITDALKLLDEIKLTADRGYAIDNEEHEPGIKCFAVPVRGYGGDVIGAISITGLKREFEKQAAYTSMYTKTEQAAARISLSMGHVVINLAKKNRYMSVPEGRKNEE